MEVWIVEAEGPIVPGRVLKVFETEALAEAEAQDLAAIVLEDLGSPGTARQVKAGIRSWRAVLALPGFETRLADENSYVEVTKHEVVMAPARQWADVTDQPAMPPPSPIGVP